MNKSWEIHKIGFVNFWYYDEQEFYFRKGRMLLRGSNGSGKSVTMQSVVPLLLDGNMRPERLDPFGSRDRKMANYLLEEGDEREERTGYLYMEWKREESDTYVTIGLGMRARRGKPMDTWYFALSDGRRIGRDFFLYKEGAERMPLSQKEMEFRLLSKEGGRLIHTQQEYMEYVNRHIFGFDTPEEYREMIDLLIQLRTPKLSKDFKPSVINEILSDSLQPLSEDDLRPMSEAIENIDSLTTTYQNKLESKLAADKILKVYNRYNQFMLSAKAAWFCSQTEECEQLVKRITQQDKEMVTENEKIASSMKKLEELSEENRVLEAEKESLNDSDASRLKTQADLLSQKLSQLKMLLEEKQKQLEQKQDLNREQLKKQALEQEKKQSTQDEIDSLLDGMEEALGEIPFDEFSFLKQELKEDTEREYSFSMHTLMLETLQEKVEQGIDILKQVEDYRKKVDDQSLETDRWKRQRDTIERKTVEYENQLVQIQNECVEAWYSWNGNNQELKLDTGLLQQISRLIENYSVSSDYQNIRDKAAGAMEQAAQILRTEQYTIRHALDEVLSRIKTLSDSLQDWKQRREPQPERSEEVLNNRERLKKKKIPFYEFYKTVDFGNSLSEEECDNLEEAFLQMGILDALVIDKSYQKEVLAMDKGMCDRYIFSGKEKVDHSILDVFDLEEGFQNIFFNQQMTSILGSIGYEAAGSTYVEKDGTYGIGIVTGRISKQHKAKYIGTRAREEYKAFKIKELEQLLEEAGKEEAELLARKERVEKRLALLQKEYYDSPKDTDLRQAVIDLEEVFREERRIREELRKAQEKLLLLQEESAEVRKEAAILSEAIYFPCRLPFFIQARQDLADYRNSYFRLQTEYGRYQRIQESQLAIRENLAYLEEDLDNIRYDLGRFEREHSGFMRELQSVKEQLNLTNYEEIKERLDYCHKRLFIIPTEREECILTRERSKNQLENIMQQREMNEKKKKLAEELKLLCREAFLTEYALGYCDREEEQKKLLVGEDIGQDAVYKMACRIKQQSGEILEKGKREELVEKINNAYFDNRGFLAEYTLTMDYLFADTTVQPEMEKELEQRNIQLRRIDIVGKYRGTKVKFSVLVRYLEEEIEELKNLLNQGDKELFEDILMNNISRKIRSRINSSFTWVEKMNELMGSMNTSSGLKLSLKWRSKTAENDKQLDTRELVELLKKDSKMMKEEEFAKLSQHFRSKVEEARRTTKDSSIVISFHAVMKETLDYRKWFEFRLFSEKLGEAKKELSNSVFGTFSGGEKAMSMYVPLFSAVVAKYQGARMDAPRIISLDEAFAGVDNKNIRDMFRLMVEFKFNFIMNSQILWGDCDTVDSLAIYQLLRPENVKFVTVISYYWNGLKKEILSDSKEMESYGSVG